MLATTVEPCGADHVEHAAGKLGAAGAACQDDDLIRHRPVILIPGAHLVAHVDRDDQRRQLLDDPGHLERTAVDGPQSRDQVDELCDLCLVLAPVAADQHVLVELVLEIAQQRRADGVKRGDDPDALGRHLLRRLRRRSLPHAERTGGLAADRRSERHGGVDEQLPGLQDALQVRHRLGLVAERDADDHRLGLLCGLLVLESRE